MALVNAEEAALYTTNKDKVSGYMLDGKEIVLGRGRGRPKEFKNPSYFSKEQKVDAAAIYCVYGNVEEVAELTGIPSKYIRLWKQEPWWIEIQKQVYVEQNEHLASKLSKTLDMTLAQLVDRLENGDVKFNRNTGEAERVPIDTKTLSTVLNNVSHHRSIVRGEPTSISANIGVDDRLRTLQEAFVKFAGKRQADDIIDITPEPENGD